MADELLLLGAGGHAKACIDVIERAGRYRVRGLVGLPHEVGRMVLGYPILGTNADLPRLAEEGLFGLVTLGQIKSAELRKRLFSELRQYLHVPDAIVSPLAYVSPHAHLGAGSIVLHGAIVNAGAVVGENCILNSLCLVEHDAQIGDHCHVATGAKLNGGVHVGAESFVGSGAVVKQGTHIGRRCIIGMGAQVLRDCPDGSSFCTLNRHEIK